MAASVLSVNVGVPEPNPSKSVPHTGIGKLPVERAELRAPGPKRGGLGSGVVGDFVGDARNHGGDQQAVYAVAREELDAWGERLGRSLPDGMFGENLTTAGLEVDTQLIGTRWAVGLEVVLSVTGPRVPCATFHRRMGEPGWTKRFTEVGRTGAYLAVEADGTVEPGDPITVLSVPDHDVTLPLAFRAFMGDRDAAARVLDAGCLAPEDDAWLRNLVARRRG